MTAHESDRSEMDFAAQPTARQVEKCATGIRGFDDMSGGGLQKGRLTAIMGAAGSGETIFALKTLANRVRDDGEACIFVTFEDTIDRLRGNAAAFDWNIAALTEAQLRFVDARIPADVAAAGALTCPVC